MLSALRSQQTPGRSSVPYLFGSYVAFNAFWESAAKMFLVVDKGQCLDAKGATSGVDGYDGAVVNCLWKRGEDFAWVRREPGTYQT